MCGCLKPTSIRYTLRWIIRRFMALQLKKAWLQYDLPCQCFRNVVPRLGPISTYRPIDLTIVVSQARHSIYTISFSVDTIIYQHRATIGSTTLHTTPTHPRCPHQLLLLSSPSLHPSCIPFPLPHPHYSNHTMIIVVLATRFSPISPIPIHAVVKEARVGISAPNSIMRISAICSPYRSAKL